MRRGLYESVVDQQIADLLAELDGQVADEKLDPADSHQILAEHLSDLIAGVLRRQPSDERLRHQKELVNRLIAVLESVDRQSGDTGARLQAPLRRLLAVYGPDEREPPRPETPLSETSLLTGTRLDPSLLSQLKQELATADRVDILCSFIKWSGVGLLQDALREFAERPGARLRVLTTSYLGATDLPAVKALAELPDTEVRVSYDVHRTRLHAKAYLFERVTGFSTAYVSSANLSRPALTDGLEWTMKVTQYADRPIWEKVLRTFDTYWQDPEFESFDEDKLRQALQRETRTDTSRTIVPAFELRPYQFQQEILETLAEDREGQTPQHRQLVVAATGTGKTMIAAFDYRRQVREAGGRYPSLLVVAHRREILEQTLATFRAVLRDENFGDLFDGRSEPGQYRHLFATVQMLHRRDWVRSQAPDAFEYVLIDETHRSAADSYQGILDHLEPRILLGLTATPERTDGEDVLRYFDDRIVSEIRLPDAINRRLVVPFHYYGLTDTQDMDFRNLAWERGGHRVADLDRLVTGNDIRARNIVEQCRRRLADVHEVRGLGFCVSIAHAEYMADFFNRSGIPAEALSADSPREVRDTAQARLRRREINFIFVVDLYNEGIDIPDVDTVLFLRPTESLTVFLQQLGRGLRLTEDKDYLTVLDFVGQMHRKFRFDQRLRALSTRPEYDVYNEVLDEFPHLPAGCSVQLERVARERVLTNIRESMLAGKSGLVRDIADFERETGREPTLANFLDNKGVEPDEVYRRGSWSRLCVQAGVREAFEAPDERRLAHWLRRIAHADDALRLERWAEWLENGKGDDALVLALAVPLLDSKAGITSPGEVWALLRRNPVLHREASELVAWLASRPGARRRRVPDELSHLPLVLHAAYTRDEILALTSVWSWEKRPDMREGARHVPEQKLDLFMATIQKSDKHYSPSTLYEDYAIDTHHFHWQSQSTTSEDSPTGKRYIKHREKGYHPLLFVRAQRKLRNFAQPYAFLGPVRYKSHEGSRPMSIVWQMVYPLPARLMRYLKSMTPD